MIGVTNKQEREQLRTELYEGITTLYRQIRAAEREMHRNRSMTARQGRATPHNIVEEICENLETPFIYRTPVDFIPKGTRTEELNLPTGRAHIVKGNWFETDGVLINGNLLELCDPVRCQFVKELNNMGITGSIRVPVQPSTCQLVLDDYHVYVAQITDEFTRLAAYTTEEAMRERVVRELWRKTKT